GAVLDFGAYYNTSDCGSGAAARLPKSAKYPESLHYPVNPTVVDATDQLAGRMNRLRSSRLANVALILLALSAYAPAINNGFIADDFALLHDVETVKANPHHVLEFAPAVFRFTSYIAFGVLKGVFGTNYWPFYIFKILLHVLNVFL